MLFRASSLLLGLSIIVCPLSRVQANDFSVFDETTQINDGFFGGLSAGDSITFNGTVSTMGFPLGGISVFLPGAPANLDVTFSAGSVTNSDAALGFVFAGPTYTGSFVNDGTISAFLPGIDFDVGVFSGSFVNTGTITSSFDLGVIIGGEVTGSIFNSGTIRGNFGGPEGSLTIFDDLETGGTLTNTGLIEGLDNHGVFIADDLEGIFRNYGTIRGLSPLGPAVGVSIGGDLDTTGVFMNSGLVEGFFEGVQIEENLMGSFLNTGTITGGFVNGGFLPGNGDGVNVFGQLSGTFQNDGTIMGTDDGFDVDLNFSIGGTIINNGLLYGQSSGVDFGRFFRGTLTNNGTIIGLASTEPGAGVEIFRSLGTQGRLNNFGTILGTDFGVDIRQILEGEIFNCGVIEGMNFTGIRAQVTTGTVRNHGGRITGQNFSIRLGGGDGTVILSGPSHLEGQIGGGPGSDTIRFENMRGINAAKQAELAAIAIADPGTGGVTLFGESINWQNVEDIQVDTSTLQSYQNLISDPGLQHYAMALDNVTGLNDSFREFLKGLNDADASLLNQILSNSSGRTVMNALDDFGREQDTNLFHLFSNQFSSLRENDVNGSLVLNDERGGVQNTGLFTQEVQVGMTVMDPEDVSSNIWVTSYVGNSEQDPNGVRASADYDSTSILFGSGKDWNENWYVGVFGAYTRNEGRVDGFGSYLENDGGYLGANAQFRSGDVFVNFAGAFGFQEVRSIRRDFLGNQMQGDTESFGGFFYSQVGRDLYMGKEGELKVSPYAGLTVSSQSYDDFVELGPVGTSLRFSDETVTAFQTVLGVNVSGHCETQRGWVRPRADLAWWHTYGGDSNFTAGLAAPGLLNGFAIASPAANQNRGIVQLGVEFGNDNFEEWTFEAGYFGVFGNDDYSSHGGTVGARLEF